MKVFFYILMILIGYSLHAQDIHFSQTKYAPLNLNPALAGAENYLQAVSNYRTQWKSVATPYTTLGISFDIRNKEKQGANGFLAYGVNFFHDVAGDARMTTSAVDLSLAYHLYLNRYSTIGLGIQGGFGQRGISPDNGTWSNQFMGNGFDTGINSGEHFDSYSFTHFDTGAGLVYHYKKGEGYMRGNDQFSLTAGIGAFHLNRPSSEFIAYGEDDLEIRYSAFISSDIGISNTNFSIMPALFYHRQGPHQEIYAGGYLRVLVTEGSKRTGFIEQLAVSYGVFYRVKDALVNKLMLEYSYYSLGMSYDVNISSLAGASRGRGGIELFFKYALPQPIRAITKSRIN